MQVASRQCLWDDTGFGTEVEVEMTPETGLFIRFGFWFAEERPVKVRWGDGSVAEERTYRSGDVYVDHTFKSYGRYHVLFENVRGLGFRVLDGQPQYAYDAAVRSVVDHSGMVERSLSACFKRAANLERIVLPGVTVFGQRDYAYCSKLREVVAPDAEYFYDGTFEHCTELERLEFVGGTMWRSVFMGCTRLRELRFSRVDQISTRCFADTPNLMDIWIPDKTIDQIRQVAPTGNIVAGYNAKFPWDANAGCRFHGKDGTVRADGVVLERL